MPSTACRTQARRQREGDLSVCVGGGFREARSQEESVLKKIGVLLLFVLPVVTVVASMAAPALAKAPCASAFRLSTNTAYIFAYVDGSWFEVVGEGDAGAPVSCLFLGSGVA